MSQITVTLPDGSERQLEAGSSTLDLAASIGRRLAAAAVAAVVNGSETDLTVPLADGATVSIVTSDSDAGRHVLRHSTAHVLAQAVTQLFPGARFTIGPAIEDGFYYDFELPGARTFSEDDLSAIESRMREIMAADQPFVRSEVSAREALEVFADQPYKCEIIERVRSGGFDGADAGEVGGGDTISVYRNSDSFVDLCRGPHVPSTGRLGKSTSYHWSRYAQREVQGRGAEEALLARDGVLIEAASAALLWREQGQWYTTEGQGELPSVTLGELRNAGLSVVAGTLRELDVSRLQALCLVSALRLVVAVREIDSLRLQVALAEASSLRELLLARHGE